MTPVALSWVKCRDSKCDGTKELRMRKCVSIADRHQLTAEFAPVASALGFLNKCQTTRLSRAMWMIRDPHVRVRW